MARGIVVLGAVGSFKTSQDFVFRVHAQSCPEPDRLGGLVDAENHGATRFCSSFDKDVVQKVCARLASVWGLEMARTPCEIFPPRRHELETNHGSCAQAVENRQLCEEPLWRFSQTEGWHQDLTEGEHFRQPRNRVLAYLEGLF